MRLAAAAGALLCGLAVALGAYASHGAEGAAAVRLGLAALFAFGHGLALVLLAPRVRGWGALVPLVLLAGVLLFSGSLVAAVLTGASTRLAPAGGGLLMLGWLVQAVASLRRR
ncbi:DUF423 domain-containing protein [Coralloluteibacterium stylophorae]|uniref:DUF423 domain-containing protein n=2 Tax=Coralloluteibacterium stylophorae TaxID=1776034 RepID=A0A8J8AW88_9GAMM|nr:DUF423 domain-containing protein [Coralloluteibacterium stylophorae]